MDVEDLQQNQPMNLTKNDTRPASQFKSESVICFQSPLDRTAASSSVTTAPAATPATRPAVVYRPLPRAASPHTTSLPVLHPYYATLMRPVRPHSSRQADTLSRQPHTCATHAPVTQFLAATAAECSIAPSQPSSNPSVLSIGLAAHSGTTNTTRAVDISCTLSDASFKSLNTVHAVCAVPQTSFVSTLPCRQHHMYQHNVSNLSDIVPHSVTISLPDKSFFSTQIASKSLLSNHASPNTYVGVCSNNSGSLNGSNRRDLSGLVTTTARNISTYQLPHSNSMSVISRISSEAIYSSSAQSSSSTGHVFIVTCNSNNVFAPSHSSSNMSKLYSANIGASSGHLATVNSSSTSICGRNYTPIIAVKLPTACSTGSTCISVSRPLSLDSIPLCSAVSSVRAASTLITPGNPDSVMRYTQNNLLNQSINTSPRPSILRKRESTTYSPGSSSRCLNRQFLGSVSSSNTTFHSTTQSSALLYCQHDLPTLACGICHTASRAISSARSSVSSLHDTVIQHPNSSFIAHSTDNSFLHSTEAPNRTHNDAAHPESSISLPAACRLNPAAGMRTDRLIEMSNDRRSLITRNTHTVAVSSVRNSRQLVVTNPAQTTNTNAAHTVSATPVEFSPRKKPRKQNLSSTINVSAQMSFPQTPPDVHNMSAFKHHSDPHNCFNIDPHTGIRLDRASLTTSRPSVLVSTQHSVSCDTHAVVSARIADNDLTCVSAWTPDTGAAVSVGQQSSAAAATLHYRRPVVSLNTLVLKDSGVADEAVRGHFVKHEHVRVKKELTRPTVTEMATQAHAVAKSRGWKVKHIIGQIDEFVTIEENIHKCLNNLLDNGRTIKYSTVAESKQMDKCMQLLQTCLQKSKISNEQLIGAKCDLEAVFQHTTCVQKIIEDYGHKRPIRKRER